MSEEKEKQDEDLAKNITVINNTICFILDKLESITKRLESLERTRRYQ